ncbi:MAG TPA: hypothetical protein VG737_05420, partial [Cyclobacteriaceae bacterium]|nr:hypothetical protein [Cyclobacteriaceae bacterium]
KNLNSETCHYHSSNRLKKSNLPHDMHMQLPDAASTILNQLTDILVKLEDKDFSKPSPALSGSTIGQHTRHTLEFFICLERGFHSGVVNYDKRAHDLLIESDKFVALNAIARIQEFISSQKDNVPLRLEVGYERDNDDCVVLSTNYLRELTYNIEHAIHHMAIMKIGINEVAPYVGCPRHFGVAASTIRHRESIETSR